jgi:tRNA pseudouridine55 synthase
VRADEAAVRVAADGLRGEIDQRVPLTSAVKVGGERLYRKARRDEKFETPVRRVHVARLEVARFDEPGQRAALVVECSSGTYVRQLVADLGEATGAGAFCEALERTAIGPFRLTAADEERLVPLVQALSFLPERALDADEERLARTGRAVENGVEKGLEDGAPNVRLTAGGELVAVAERREGQLKPVTVIPA